jgi:Na+-translocating ferredoxin:NAD+ oxidoreductase RnfC subunit
MQVSDLDSLSKAIRDAGIAGAGGAGFPSYAKWKTLENIDYLLVNHQESEPNFYADKWLGRKYTQKFKELFDYLLANVFKAIVIGTKAKYREEWTRSLESTLDSSVYCPADLPLDVDEVDNIAFGYTPDVYTYSEEEVLLMVTVGEQIGDDLPTDHGWIVHNTETLYNIHKALSGGRPVTRKYVHVDGDIPHHRCLEVPVGTTVPTLLEAAGVEGGSVGEASVLADGGPGWCYEIEAPLTNFGVRKRTNALLVIDEETARESTREDGQINVLDSFDWQERDHEVIPNPLQPGKVRIPLLTNEGYRGFVSPSDPIVNRGDVVTEGEKIAVPDGDISNTQHASIGGTVTDITETHITIEERA